jgi:hypothetical protein
MKRSVRIPLLPLLVLIAALLVGVSVFVAGLDLWIERGDAAAFRSDLRGLVTVAILGSLGWLGLRWAIDQMNARLDQAAARLDALNDSNVAIGRYLVDRDADTQPIPRLYVAGTAAVAPQPAPPPAAPDPKVVEIGERIARKIIES